MSHQLRDFLVDLASDPSRMSRYLADPAGAVEGMGLSADERAALLGRDPERLRRALGTSPADVMTRIGKKKGGKKKPGGRKRPGAKKRPARRASRKK